MLVVFKGCPGLECDLVARDLEADPFLIIGGRFNEPGYEQGLVNCDLAIGFSASCSNLVGAADSDRSGLVM